MPSFQNVLGPIFPHDSFTQQGGSIRHLQRHPFEACAEQSEYGKQMSCKLMEHECTSSSD